MGKTKFPGVSLRSTRQSKRKAEQNAHISLSIVLDLVVLFSFLFFLGDGGGIVVEGA